jgi:TP901 family phage tail tape measure protein
MAASISRAGVALTIGITAPVLMLAKASLAVAESFESNMNRVQAATGATGEQIKLLGGYADQLGVKLGVLPTDVSKGMYIAAQAGMSVNDVYSQMPTVLELSRIGAVSVDDAVRLLTSTMTDFGFKGSEGAQKVGNMMAIAVNKSLAELPDLIASMRYAAPTASALNIKFEELMGTFKVLADHGIKASQAGTSINEMMNRMLNPTKKATEALAGYGLTVDDINPRLHTLAEIFDKLGSKRLEPAALALIFGTRGERVATPLEQIGGAGITEATKEMSGSQGTLDTMYNTVNQGFPGAVRRFSAELQVFEGTLGVLLKKDLIPFIDKLTELMHKFEGLSPAMQDHIVKFALYAAVIGPVLLVTGKLMQVIQELSGMFNFVSTAGEGLIGSFGKIENVFSSFVKIGEYVYGAFGGIKGAVISLVEYLATASFDEIVLGIVDAIVAAISGIVGTISLATVAFAALGIAIVAIAAVLLDAAYKTGYLGKVFEIMKDIVVIAVNVLVNVAIKLYDGFNKAVDAVIKFGQTIYEQVPGAKQVIDALNESLDGFIKTLDNIANQSTPDWNRFFPSSEQVNNSQGTLSNGLFNLDTPFTNAGQVGSNSAGTSEIQSYKNMYGDKWETYYKQDHPDGTEQTTYNYNEPSGGSTGKQTIDTQWSYQQQQQGNTSQTIDVDAVKKSYQNMYGDKWEAAYNTDHPNGLSSSKTPTEVQSQKYSIDQYGQLKETVTDYVKTINQDEITAYQKAAKVAGETATFKVMSDGTVQASMTKTITLLATEKGKYEEAKAAAADNSVVRNVENTRDAMNNLSSKTESIQTTYKNGAKIITDTVTNAVKDSLGKIINYTKDVTQTIDNGVSQIVNKTSSAFSNTNNRAIENTIDAYGNLKQVVTDTAETVKNGVDTITTKVTTNLYDANRSLISSTANVTEEMKKGSESIKTTYDDITNSYSALTNKVSNTYKNASGQSITESYFTNAKGVSASVPKTPSVATSVPSTPNAAAVMTSDSAKDLTSSLSNINNISFSKFISNLSAAEKILSNMASLSKQVNSNLSLKGGAGSGTTVNNSNCVKIANYHDHGEKSNAKKYWGAKVSKS